MNLFSASCVQFRHSVFRRSAQVGLAALGLVGLCSTALAAARRAFMLAAIFLWLAGHASTSPAQTSFYDAPRSLLAGGPGTLVRQEQIDGAPLGAAAYRVLYRSTGLRGEPIFVSGVVVVPQGEPPVDGRPIIAWAHPTSGITPR